MWRVALSRSPDADGAQRRRVIATVNLLILTWIVITGVNIDVRVAHTRVLDVAPAAELGGRQVVAVLVSAAMGVVLHEGAHALVARAAGLGIRRISIGIGWRLLHRSVVTVRTLPTSGYVQVAQTGRGFVAFLLAGNVATAAVAAVMWWVTASGPLHAYRWALVGTQIYYLLMNAVPRAERGTRPNDATRLRFHRMRMPEWGDDRSA